MLVAVVQRWGGWIATELSATKANVLDSSCMLSDSAGGNSLITHSTTAEGIDEPGKRVHFRFTKQNHSRKQLSIIQYVSWRENINQVLNSRPCKAIHSWKGMDKRFM